MKDNLGSEYGFGSPGWVTESLSARDSSAVDWNTVPRRGMGRVALVVRLGDGSVREMTYSLLDRDVDLDAEGLLAIYQQAIERTYPGATVLRCVR